MRILSRPAVFNAIQQAKSLTEEQANAFLSTFYQNNPAIGQTFLSGFPMIIEVQSEPMSHVFMDTCFDIIYVYAQILGELPANAVSAQWLQHKMKTLENEAKTQSQADIKNNAQTELLEYIDLVIDDAADKSKAGQAVATLTCNLLFLVTRLFDSIYDELIADTVH
ncbi:MAG: hypothetical protein Q8N30_15010 [Methylococcales bacterium]|nr:hypothetical protein [Methylococcales bacterium]